MCVEIHMAIKWKKTIIIDFHCQCPQKRKKKHNGLKMDLVASKTSNIIIHFQFDYNQFFFFIFVHTDNQTQL